MRLLNVDTFTFTEFFFGATPPSYAIASHRWLGGEATLEDVRRKRNTDSPGYRKVQGFVDYMRAHLPLIKYLWIDTCCIRQDNERELSESINSMFRWYREAEVCLAYLQDVPDGVAVAGDSAMDFDRSIWFQRGWTIQELLAPATVVFLSSGWQVIGHKGRSGYGRAGTPVETGPALDARIAAITKIPQSVLQDYDAGRNLAAEEKFKWLEGRRTTCEEDMSYCMIGLLDVDMGIRYGVGGEKTRARLLRIVADRQNLASQKFGRENFRVPFSLEGLPLVDNFVPREFEMQELRDFFATGSLPTTQQRQQIFVVYGMGGMGKTQLCVEFARAHAKQFSAVFWLDGSSKDTLLQGMASAASRIPSEFGSDKWDTSSLLTTQDREDPAKLRDNFLRWLELTNNTRWLLIIDNIDRDWQGDEPDPQAYDFRKVIPQADHGKILITTRLARLRRPNSSLLLGNVDDQLAKEILEARAGRALDGVEMLLPKLGGMPLALAQAGAYLGTTGMSVPEYLSYYNATESWTDLMQKQNQFPLAEYSERSVLTTWKISYDQVKKADPLAARILDAWAFLNHNDVWPELVLAGQSPETPEALKDELLSRATLLSVKHSISILVQYSLVNAGNANQRHTIHPVVHAWLLHNLDDPSTRERVLAATFHSLANLARTTLGRHRAARIRLLAQGSAIGGIWRTPSEFQGEAEDVFDIGRWIGEWKAPGAVELTAHASRLLAKKYGRDHMHTLNAEFARGIVYLNRGEFQQAENILTPTLQALTESGHSARFMALCTIGRVYAGQSKMMAAEDSFSQAMEGADRALDIDHENTLRIMLYLSEFYEKSGRLADAERVLVRLLRGRHVGPDGPYCKIFKATRNLSHIYERQERWQEAEVLFKRVLVVRTEFYGLDHPRTYHTYHDLWRAYYRQGKLPAAEELLLQRLRAEGTAHGAGDRTSDSFDPNDVIRLRIGVLLGITYLGQDRLLEAESMLSRVLQGFKSSDQALPSYIKKTERELACVRKKLAASEKAESLSPEEQYFPSIEAHEVAAPKAVAPKKEAKWKRALERLALQAS